jgi:hypothetical protein
MAHHPLIKIHLIAALILGLLFACKEPYEPPAVKTNPNLLVVDGILFQGNDSSILTISHTRLLTDTGSRNPELNAGVTLVDESGSAISFAETGNGRYAVGQLNLNPSSTYRLLITLSNGLEYQSDPMPVKITPPIDSLEWTQDSTGAHFFVNTHDPSNQTRYYRYEYVESWEYHAAFQSDFEYVNGEVVLRPVMDRLYICFQSLPSANINVTTSNRLTDDVIYHFHLYTVPIMSEKLGFRYSTLVNQYAIGEEAYHYWSDLKKNTEQLGTLFDAQPYTPQEGNIHNINNPQEIVLGYMSISTLQSKRIFIDHGQLDGWGYLPYYGTCDVRITIPDSAFYYFPPGGNIFFTFIGTNMGFLLYSTSLCGDCRWHGGSNVKPPFWP